MNRFKKIIPICLFLIIIVASCSSDEGEGEVNTVDPPTAATLIFPENNTECNEGIVISDTETDVLFQWEEATNASSYELQITDLNDGTSRNISTLSNEFLIRILRGTPYSWSVKSLASGTTETAESAVWKFYNAGLPEESHPPFPADAVSPQSGASVNEGVVNLQWEASDVDNDIASYTIYFDTSNPPTTEAGNTSTTNTNVTVMSGQVYYWKVVTTDEIGNASNSQIFQFGVN
ncbi:MAG: hypothetical protein V7719_10500 [Psychroserpens sp.]|uniref:hypothetical protein n=1 Tax=Psychroserpens sp. TaxID=2020870 RepID=UPI0030035063